MLKIPAAASCHAGRPLRLALHPAGLSQSRRGCCFDKKERLSSVIVSVWACSIGRFPSHTNLHSGYWIGFLVEKSIKTTKKFWYFLSLAMPSSEVNCSGFWLHPTRLRTSLIHNVIAHRAGGSGNLTAPPVPPDQNPISLLPPSSLPSPCKLEVELFFWDGSLKDAVPNVLVRIEIKFGCWWVRLHFHTLVVDWETLLSAE